MIFYSLEGKVICHWEEDVQAVRVEWLESYYFGNEFSETLLKCLDYLRLRGARKWIVDTSAATGVLKPADTEWLAQRFMPRAAQAGLRYIATVVPKNVLTRLSNKVWEQAVEQDGFIMLDVRSVQEAKEWLKKQP